MTNAFTLAQVMKMFKNLGVDVECGACMSVAFTGVTTDPHTCRDSKMNIIPVDQQPAQCPSCGRKQCTSLKACGSNDCLRVNLSSFIINSTRHGDLRPHVHVKCDYCSFTYLIEPADAKEVERLL